MILMSRYEQMTLLDILKMNYIYVIDFTKLNEKYDGEDKNDLSVCECIQKYYVMLLLTLYDIVLVVLTVVKKNKVCFLVVECPAHIFIIEYTIYLVLVNILIGLKTARTLYMTFVIVKDIYRRFSTYLQQVNMKIEQV